MNKNLKIAIVILFIGALLGAGIYAGLRWYFTENPVVICGDDVYSKGCLVTYAEELKLDKKAFIQCVNGTSTDNTITNDLLAADALELPAGPALFVGQVTDNSAFVGFYVSVGSYADLKIIADNALNYGIAYAQTENLKAVTTRLDASVKQYLEGQGFTGDAYNSELAKIQPDIDDYLAGFELFSLQMKVNNIRGSIDNGIAFIYFVDYGSQYTSGLYTALLSEFYAEYVDTGTVAIVYKENARADEVSGSKALANAALCAGQQNKYFEYSDFLHTL